MVVLLWFSHVFLSCFTAQNKASGKWKYWPASSPDFMLILKCVTSVLLIGLQRNLCILTFYEAPLEYFYSYVGVFTPLALNGVFSGVIRWGGGGGPSWAPLRWRINFDRNDMHLKEMGAFLSRTPLEICIDKFFFTLLAASSENFNARGTQRSDRSSIGSRSAPNLSNTVS